MNSDKIISQVLSFWFGEPGSPDYELPKDFWFQSTDELDDLILKKFELIYQKAIQRELDYLLKTPEGALALILLLDQFPRNMYRGTPQAFASDFLALEIAGKVIEKGCDQKLSNIQRTFLYLPFEHSEDLKMQEKSVQLFYALGNQEALRYAVDHRDIIARFGRFPHRNAILGRKSTLEEINFLKKSGHFSFGQIMKEENAS